MRGRPDIFSRIQGVLYNGQDVTILDRVGKWLEVATPNFRGYIYEAYLQM